MGHVCFLEQASTRRAARLAVKESVGCCRDHPAVLMYAVAKELPPQIIRWYGKKKIEAFLRDLVHVAKDEDSESLVTYTNFPTTEYLELPFVDVQTFNVYLHQRRDFCSYLSRLQHNAGEKPLVLTELGMCSFRHGRDGQAQFLNWQIEEAFDHGLAGAVVFGWTDPFFQDGCLVNEWGFGLVDAERRPKPSYDVIRDRFTSGVPFASARKWPKISVVVALHNAETTLDDCLKSLAKLDYPDYEVIVVNDGSTDQSQAIIEKYPFRSIRIESQAGVSNARNQGLHAATGEIVAYIDSDAYADPQWLRYLAATFLEGDFTGVGGPNLVPQSDNWIAKCVYRSPGGPCQVMFDDQSAEHIPGCNMAFRKRALEEVGGFDPIFTAAGDDVDICWRLLARNYRLGFSPSAEVWHHRRPSLRAYWRQQVGYGEAEALLERRHPNKFNPWGHTYWGGTIYAPYPRFRLSGRPAIYYGLWGNAPFQSMYDPGGGALSFLPRAMELHVILIALIAICLVFPWASVVAVVGVTYIFFYCASCGANARIDVLEDKLERVAWGQRLKWRATIGWLHFLEPFARDWGRLRGGLTPWRSVLAESIQRPRENSSWWQRLLPFKRRVQWSYAGDMRLEKNNSLDDLTRMLTAHGCAVGWNPSFETWDLKLRRGALGEAWLRMVVEHHGGPKRLARFSMDAQPTQTISWTLTTMVLGAAVSAAIGLLLPSVAFAVIFVTLWFGSVRETNRLYSVLRHTTDDLNKELLVDNSTPA
jgi:cellulose synthase/poly-beta-1,6-N-acetylglucosamine synthase-like glycosyltransferase